MHLVQIFIQRIGTIHTVDTNCISSDKFDLKCDLSPINLVILFILLYRMNKCKINWM